MIHRLRRRGSNVRPWWIGLLIALILVLPRAGSSNSDGEEGVKAAFIYNFAKFTEWPAANTDAPLLICSVGSQPLSGKLALLHGRRVLGREVHVRTQMRAEQWRDCRILFVSDGDTPRPKEVIAALGALSVLTVSDSEGFIHAGGMIGLKPQFGRIRFDINLAAVRRSGLKLNSQMVDLADEVLK
ncbi:MAG: YfiR family protein [Rhodoferax sp.]|nr:YfiR family protein [Rhodoferax sp.]